MVGPCKDLGSEWRGSQRATMQGKAVPAVIVPQFSTGPHPTPIPDSKSNVST